MLGVLLTRAGRCFWARGVRRRKIFPHAPIWASLGSHVLGMRCVAWAIASHIFSHTFFANGLEKKDRQNGTFFGKSIISKKKKKKKKKKKLKGIFKKIFFFTRKLD